MANDPVPSCSSGLLLATENISGDAAENAGDAGENAGDAAEDVGDAGENAARDVSKKGKGKGKGQKKKGHLEPSADEQSAAAASSSVVSERKKDSSKKKEGSKKRKASRKLSTASSEDQSVADPQDSGVGGPAPSCPTTSPFTAEGARRKKKKSSKKTKGEMEHSVAQPCLGAEGSCSGAEEPAPSRSTATDVSPPVQEAAE